MCEIIFKIDKIHQSQSSSDNVIKGPNTSCFQSEELGGQEQRDFYCISFIPYWLYTSIIYSQNKYAINIHP